MKKTITYLGIEQVQYLFDKKEILEALMQRWEIPNSYDREFYLSEGSEDEPAYAELIIKYASVKDNEEKP